MKKIIALVLVAVLTGLLSACGSAESDDEEPRTVKISTPFAELTLSGKIDENVDHSVTCEEPYTLTFSAKKDQTELFSIVFNGTGEILMGTIVGDDASTVVYMNVPELDRNSENYDEYCAYQEGVNDILNGLMRDYVFQLNEIAVPEDNSTFDITTDFAIMKYPAKWRDRVKVEVSATRVKFSDGDTPLFDLVFEDCNGYLLGTCDGTPIYIIDYPVETNEQAAMQEDVNVILQHLMEDPLFTISQ